jgi:hypothetical protein
VPWFKVDDKLHDHRKARRAGKAAMGVWVLAGSWSMDNDYDGFVPEDVLSRWGSRADAERLVAAGLWDPERFNGEQGWRFHDWARFQPSAAVTAATKAKEAEAGLLGNHRRWHVARRISDPDCEFCYRAPDQEPDGEPDTKPDGPPESGANRPVPVPVPDVSPDGDTRPRPDVERICEHLADRIEANGSKRPAITKSWRDAARLMLDRDGHTPQEIHGAIEWSQAHEFWRANILSLPKLREKYDQLRLQAERRNGVPGPSATDALFERARARGAQ